MAEGDDLRTWRERLGMTQAELGSRLRPMAAQHTVSRWETGERRIPPGLWQALQWIEHNP